MRFLPFLLEKKRKEREEKSLIIRYLLIALGVFAVLCLVGGGVLAYFIFDDLPDIGDLNKDLAASTVIQDRNGNELYKLFKDENRIYVPLDRVSTHFLHAILAAEDRKFYSHPGVDILGIIRAQVSNFQGNSTQGASTISQQVVKNLVTKDKKQNYIRKLREAVLAYQLEQKYSKDKILELYINQSPFGGNSYGIMMASRNFFNKDPKELDIAQSAVLASLPKGPALYSPFGENRDLLMGYCKVGGDAPENVGELDAENTEQNTSDEVVVTAREKVWLKITGNTDKKDVFVGTLEKGDQTSFPASQSYSIQTGNKNFDLFVGATQVELPKDKNFSFDPKSFAQKKDAAPTTASPKPTTGNLASGCSSMDDPNYVDGRKDFVLRGMQEEGFITKEERDQAWKESHTLVFTQAKESIKYPHFVMFVREYLEKKYGEDVGKKGLIVRTTIDPELQDMAQEIVKRKGDSYAKNNKIGNAALVSVDPTDGEILAMVGSRDYWDETSDGNVNVTVRKRQPGSSFKPFIYSQLFEGPWGPGSVLWDVKTRFGGSYPNNYEGGFKGPMTVRAALAASRNIPPIKAYFLNDGEEKTLEFLSKMGFGYIKEYADQQNEGKADEDKFYYGYPIAIGSAEVRPLDMAAGYAIFSNGGTYFEPTPILEIKTQEGEVLESIDKERGKKAIDPQIAYEITSILSDASARPAGFWRAALTTPGVVTAAKTGTSNKRFGATVYPSDLWTVGYSRSISTAVWVGNNDGSRLAQGQDGLNFAAPIWKEFMLKAHDKREKGNFEQPEGITKVTVSTLSGKKASKTTPPGYSTTDIFASWAVPKEYDTSTVAKQIDRRNGLLAGDNCDQQVVETVYIYNVHSERPNLKDWEAPVLAWARSKGLGSSNPSANGNTNTPRELPKDNSDCKPVSEDDKLRVSIGYPKDGGLVQSGSVSVDAEINAPFGLSKVEYYVDGALATTRTGAPFNAGSVTIGSAEGSHVIKVIAYDQNGVSATSSVTVKTGTDTGRPTVTINAPTAGASVPQGSSLNISFEASDSDSPLKRVDVYVDGKLLKTVTGGPQSLSLLMEPSKYAAGSHSVKVFATDAVGNTATGQSSFTVTKPSASSTETAPPAANENKPVTNTNADASLVPQATHSAASNDVES